MHIETLAKGCFTNSYNDTANHDARIEHKSIYMYMDRFYPLGSISCISFAITKSAKGRDIN